MNTITAAQIREQTGVSGRTLRRWVATAVDAGQAVPGVCGGGKGRDYTADILPWIRSHPFYPTPHTPERQEAHVQHLSTGLTPATKVLDGASIWEQMEARQVSDESLTCLRYSQTVEIPDKRPVALALLSDIHIGNEHTDYHAARKDAETIRDTPGMYAALLGDTVDNWIGKLERISRAQPVTHAEEMALLRHWLKILSPKLIACVSGNHDNRTHEIAGIDLLAEFLRDESNLLYDADELTFSLQLAAGSLKIACRHKWPGHSIYNVTHGIERAAKFNGDDWDIGIGGHTHRGTFFRWFADGIRTCVAVQLGTYEFSSKFARQCGFGRPPLEHRGCGALIIWPDGHMEAMRSVQDAAGFITYLRNR